MAGGNRDRQRATRRARVAAAQAAERRRARRRRWITVVAAAAVVVALVALTAGTIVDDDDNGTVSAGLDDETSTGSTSPAVESAAGKPCVPVAEALPEGAPDVPVRAGAPPGELIVEDLVAGDGATVTADATLTVNYIGVSCSTGQIFDESYSAGQPATFPLSGVIPGWQEGLGGMQVGGRRLLGIPPEMAYGAEGFPPDIAPDETLWFVVDVIDATTA